MNLDHAMSNQPVLCAHPSGQLRLHSSLRPTGPEVDSFYSLAGVELDHRFCRGLGCFAAQRLDPERWRKAMAQWPPVYCLGKCYNAPSSADEDVEPVIETRCKDPIVLAGVPGGEVRALKD